MSQDAQRPELHWEAQDFERRLGFKGAKYTGTNPFLTLIIGAVLSVAFYACLAPFMNTPVGRMFLARESKVIPAAIVFLSGWSVGILFVKWRKLKLQRRALEFSMPSEQPGFVLSPLTADEIIDRLYSISDDPAQFLLLNRIKRSLSNLKHIGRVADIDDILRSQAENDQNYTDSSYTLLHGFVWAIPVFGFIGTVLGLSSAIGGFGQVLAGGAELGILRDALQGVTGGLATAFETTLIGLVSAVLIQLALTLLRKAEEDFLDACDEYCHRYIVSRLRVLPAYEETPPGSEL